MSYNMAIQVIPCWKMLAKARLVAKQLCSECSVIILEVSMVRRFGFYIVILLILGATLIGVAQKARAQGQHNSAAAQQPDIVGGQEADIAEYPWQVYLETSKSPNERYMCGASLIAPQWVLTAAHCVYDESSNRLLTVDVVVLGAHDLSLQYEAGRQIFHATQVIVHPGYDAYELDNDLALIELDSVAQITDYVAPVGLAASPDDAWMLAAGVEATVTGWGEMGGTDASDVLMEVAVAVVDRQTCQAAYAHLGYGVSINMLCAGYPAGGKDTCRGDSGGPLIVPDGLGNWKQIGIVSWGYYPCAQPDYYGVYTRVSNYATWISQQIGELDATPTPLPTATPSPTQVPAVTATATPSPTATATPIPSATPASSPVPIVNLVANSDFEATDTSAWHISSLQGRILIRSDLPVSPASGNYVAWLGDADDEESRLWQPVVLPTSKPLYLSYDYAVVSSDLGCFRDVGKVYLGSLRIMQYVLCSDTTTLEWQHEVISLEPFIGQVLNLQFFVRTNASQSSALFIDNVRISSTLASGEVPVSAVGIDDGEAGQPGKEVEASTRLFLPILAR